jgi:uncharacterized membrane protein
MQPVYGGKSFEVNTFEAIKAGRVFVWSLASVAITFGIAVVGSIEVTNSAQWVGLAVPLINAVLYLLKEMVADNSERSLE